MAAFDTLVARYADRVYSYAYQMLGDVETARETTQDIFLRIYTHIDRFRRESSFSTWLFTIASSTCKNARNYNSIRAKRRYDNKRDKSDPESRLSILDIVPDNSHSPELVTDRRDTAAIVKTCIAELPEHYRQVITLKDINELSYEQIAGVIGCEIGTVKSRLARARLLMREKLVKQGIVGPGGEA